MDGNEFLDVEELYANNEDYAVFRTERPIPQVIRFDDTTPFNPRRDAEILAAILLHTLPEGTLYELKKKWFKEFEVLESELQYLRSLSTFLMSERPEKKPTPVAKNEAPTPEAGSKTVKNLKKRLAKEPLEKGDDEDLEGTSEN